MRRALLFAAMTLTAALAEASVVKAQGAAAEAPSPFRIEIASADGPRGLGVQGYLYNGLPWRITNVRLRVEGLDANGGVTESVSGWVMGDVTSGGRGYFYVPVSSEAPTYRATVQSFDKIAVDPPRFEAP